MKPLKRIFRSLLKVFNGIAAFLLAFSYLSIYTNPQHITLPAFGGLAYVYLLLINLCFLLLWLFIQPRFALVSASVILLGFQNLEHFFQWNFESQKPGRNFKVISYNVRLFNRYNWDKTGNTSGRIGRYLKRESADIVCLQEFYLDKSEKRNMLNAFQLGQNTRYHHVREIAHNYQDITALATFSTYPVVNKGRIPFYNSTNGCIYTDLLMEGDTIRVYNCHLQSVRFGGQISDYLNNLSEKGYNRGRVKRIINKLSKAYKKRALQINDLMAHIEKAPYPVLVCGDFNDTPFSYTYNRLSEKLRDAFMDAGRGLGYTYRTHLMPLRIDYLFYSSDFSASEFTVNKAVKLSDHYPVQVELQLAPSKTGADQGQHSHQK